MNTHEIERIADAFNRLRPDWPRKQLVTLLNDARMIGRPRRDVVVALGWVACESDTGNPYRVIEQGPWWKAAALDQTAIVGYTPPRRGEACITCGRHLTNCGCGEQRTRPEIPAAEPARSAGLDLARANLAQAVAQLCPHHAKSEHCSECRDQEDL